MANIRGKDFLAQRSNHRLWGVDNRPTISDSSDSNPSVSVPIAILPHTGLYSLLPVGQTFAPPAVQDPILDAVLRLSYPVVTDEGTHHINREADVERILNLYIVHTVNLIFEEYLWRLTPQRKLACMSQVIDGASRMDLLWAVDGITILVMEVKIYGAIRPYEWREALPPGHWNLQQQIAALNQKVQRITLQQGSFKSLLGGNAGVMIKQVCKYVEGHSSPNILIFDWKHMILLDMHPGVNDAQWTNDNHNYPRCHITDDDEDFNFRRLLLAALLDGFRRVFPTGL